MKHEPTPLRVVITGVGGRMGATLVHCVSNAKGMLLVGGTERAGSPSLGHDLGVAVTSSLREVLEKRGADVVIDFTTPNASVEHAAICAERRVALVIGSTGFSEAARNRVVKSAKKTPVVLAPNMSVGVNLVVQVAAHLARVLGESFDVEITEAHHRMKKDAPSGTALRLAEEIATSLGRSTDVFRKSRDGNVGTRPNGEIGITAIRGGDVVGDHTVFFLGDGERVELTHRATSRDTFALGALRAARWVAQQAPGLYGMQEVLGLGNVGVEPRNPRTRSKG